jgi:hypothetical protein
MYAPHANQPRPGIFHLFLLRYVLPSSLDALQNVLAILVQLQLRDDDLGGVDADGHRLAGRLLLDDSLDVDDILEAVDGGDLSLPSLVGTPDNSDLVVFSDGDGADLRGRVSAQLGTIEGQDIRCTSHGAPCSMGRS